ncbi:MAG: hypothetical protein R3202_11515 [Candidatus Competibacterales bacterium]|nr:hypothetical protein [Candidatus Competibacterales bacterium]
MTLVAVLLLMTACTSDGRYVGAPARIDISPERIKVSPVDGQRPPRHCPPGHAKKDWC